MKAGVNLYLTSCKLTKLFNIPLVSVLAAIRKFVASVYIDKMVLSTVFNEFSDHCK